MASSLHTMFDCEHHILSSFHLLLVHIIGHCNINYYTIHQNKEFQWQQNYQFMIFHNYKHTRIIKNNRPYSRCQSLKPSLVFLNRASYGRRRNNNVTSQEREVTMMLRHNLRTDAQICGKSATQAYLFVRHGRGVNRVCCLDAIIQKLNYNYCLISTAWALLNVH